MNSSALAPLLAICMLLVCSTAGAAPAKAPRPSTLAEAVELIMVGGADFVTVDSDPMVREAMEKSLGRPTRIAVHVAKVADLGGEGCKRIAWRVIALDVPIRTAGSPDGYFATTAQWSICSNGQPPEPGDELPKFLPQQRASP